MVYLHESIGERAHRKWASEWMCERHFIGRTLSLNPFLFAAKKWRTLRGVQRVYGRRISYSISWEYFREAGYEKWVKTCLRRTKFVPRLNQCNAVLEAIASFLLDCLKLIRFCSSLLCVISLHLSLSRRSCPWCILGELSSHSANRKHRKLWALSKQT